MTERPGTCWITDTTGTRGDYLMIAIPLKPDLPLSGSGKSHILAQTLGFTKTDLVYKGKPVTIAAISAIVPLDK